MSMTDFVVVMVLVMIVGLAVTYMVKAKKRGDKCIGCPSGGKCKANKNNSSCCCCNCDAQNSSEDNIK